MFSSATFGSAHPDDWIIRGLVIAFVRLREILRNLWNLIVAEVLRLGRIPFLIVAVSLIGAAPPFTAFPTYSLDHIVLGSAIGDAIRSLGAPNISSNTVALWGNSYGGTVTVVADSDGHITLIDVIAGEHERRQIDAAGGAGTLGETGHVNFIEPQNATLDDSCGAGLIGAPCLAYTLPGGVELVENFGDDNGFADWALSEIVLGNRNQLLASGRVIAGR